MRLPRFRIRTLMIAVASAAIGFAAAPRTWLAGYRAYAMSSDSSSNYENPRPSSPIYIDYSPHEVVAMAAVIGAFICATVVGILAIFPRMTVRQRAIAVGAAGAIALLVTAEILREHWTERAVYCRRRAWELAARVGFSKATAAMHQAKGNDEAAATFRRNTAKLRAGWVSFDRTARYPWLPVPPDPQRAE